MGFVIVRKSHYDERLKQWQPEVTAGLYREPLWFVKSHDAEEVAELLNKADVGFWQVQDIGGVDAPSDDHDLHKYKSNVREHITQMSWLHAKSDVGYVIVDIVVATYAILDIEGTVDIGLLTPFGEERRADLVVPIYTKADAKELAAYRNERGDSDIHSVPMAVEIYKLHWNQQAEVGLVPPELLAKQLKEARE